MTNYNQKKEVLKSMGLSAEEIEKHLESQFPEYKKIKVLQDLGLSESEIEKHLKQLEPDPLYLLHYNLLKNHEPDQILNVLVKNLESSLGISTDDLIDMIIDQYLTIRPLEDVTSDPNSPSNKTIIIDGVTYDYNKEW